MQKDNLKDVTNDVIVARMRSYQRRYRRATHLARAGLVGLVVLVGLIYWMVKEW